MIAPIKSLLSVLVIMTSSALLKSKSTPQAADLRGFLEVAFMCNSPD